VLVPASEIITLTPRDSHPLGEQSACLVAANVERPAPLRYARGRTEGVDAVIRSKDEFE